MTEVISTDVSFAAFYLQAVASTSAISDFRQLAAVYFSRGDLCAYAESQTEGGLSILSRFDDPQTRVGVKQAVRM